MNNPAREYIAIGFDDQNIIPVIKMNQSGCSRKIIHDVTGIKEIIIYYMDFDNQRSWEAGRIQWPDSSLISDVMIQYDPEEYRGTISIMGMNQSWAYSVSDGEKEQSTDENNVVDKNKIRELEKENHPRMIWPDELAAELTKNVFGQDEAICRISEIIVANLRRKSPEVEVIMLFGPTGVGKTETGKALPQALKKLTGQEYGFCQVSMNQYTESHSIHQFFGAPPSYAGYKDPTIFEPCRTNPYQVYLLDEIEKSTERIWTGLMECFSNSFVRLADNTPKIDLSHVIFILTSNITVDLKEYNGASVFRKSEICRDALTKNCGYPEVAGKISNCLAFQELSSDTITDIVLKFVALELQNVDMELGHMDEHLMVQLKAMHKNSRYGARSVKDAVRTALKFTMYDREIDKYKGKKVSLSGDVENIKITVIS